jgi:hypothetical protein
MPDDGRRWILKVAVGLGPSSRLSEAIFSPFNHLLRGRLGQRLCPYVIAGALFEQWLLSSTWSWLKRLSWGLTEHRGCVALLPKVSSDTLTFSNATYCQVAQDSLLQSFLLTSTSETKSRRQSAADSAQAPSHFSCRQHSADGDLIC